MNITITGNLGSGKTSVCNELKKYGFTIISAGDIFREIAAEKGMTVIELNEAAKSDRSIDDMLDQRSTQLGKEMDHTVFDSRLAWHFVEKSFKVFLLVDTKEAARRVFEGNNRSAEVYQNAEEACIGLKTRARLEQERFSDLYQLNYYDASNYDLIIESSCAAPLEIAQEIKRNFELYQSQPFTAKVELNLRSLYPAGNYNDMDLGLFDHCRLAEQKNSASLCALEPVSITVKHGYNYVLGAPHSVFAAAAAGKVFTEVKGIQMDEKAQEAVMPLSEDELKKFEQAGQFQYTCNPAVTAEKSGYMLDFSNSIFCG